MEKEISYLKESNFTIYHRWDVEEVLNKIDDGVELYHLILLGPVEDDANLYTELARKIRSIDSTPLLFYCKNCTETLLNQLNKLPHQGIIPSEAGNPFLKSQLIRAIGQRQNDPQKGIDPLTRLIDNMREANKESKKSDYGYIVAGLTDAVIIDREGEGIAIANKKACEILGLTLEDVIDGRIYSSGWDFVHEDLSTYPPEEHPHVLAHDLGEPVKNAIMGINRPYRETLWISVSSLPVFHKDEKSLLGVITTFYDISELVNIRKNNLRLAAIFQYAEWGIVIADDEGSILQVNPSFARSHGYSMEELVNKPVTFIYPEHEIEQAKRHLLKSRRKQHYRYESVHKRKDGSTFPVIVDITSLEDGSGKVHYKAANIIDITDRKKQEKELHQSLEELRKEKEYSDALFHNSPIAIYSLDREGKVVNFNQKAEEVTGYKYEEIIGKKFDMILHNEQGEKSLGKEYKIKTKEGNERIIEKYSSLVYDEEGAIAGDIESFLDITDWKDLEIYKSDIERIIRHDLKTPLNSIIGFPKLMLTDEDLSDEYREYLMIILLAGQNMLNLINATLNLNKLEQGNYEVEEVKTDVAAVLKQIKKILQDNCRRKRCKLDIRINQEPINETHKIELYTEQSLLFMILVNLITNAIDATPRGEDIQVYVEQKDDILIKIHNKGAIPEQIRDRFFDKNITYGKKHGNGLGTYSAKLMANAIHADLSFTTSEKEGTTLFLKLHWTVKQSED